ncbi:hypothetical protein CsSME_00022468 [Camellia sinensis var. sinensis]
MSFLRHRNHSISASDPKPRTQFLSQSSTFKPTISNNNNNIDGSNETKKLLTKKPKKKKLFTSVTLRGLGCGAASPVVTAADLEAERVRRRKKNKKKQRRTTTSSSPNTQGVVVVVDVQSVCCAPGVGIASDVVPRTRVDSERTNHRVRSCSARGTTNVERASASDLPSAFDTNNAHRLRRHSPRQLPQFVMFQHNLLFGGSLDGYDQHGDWMFDVDNMSYEELLNLGDRIGYVGTGLHEDEIFRCLRKSKHSMSESFPLLKSTNKDWKCSICQEGWKADDKMGRLDCGHYHHLHCIKKWLLQKNACPVCKTAAVANK